MTDCDLLLVDARVATMRPQGDGLATIDDGALAIRNGTIAWVGGASAMPVFSPVETRSLGGRWLTPALIDCHTHVVFGGDRAGEFERRLQGIGYEQIAREGGGILSTVHATRAASDRELFDSAMRRVRQIARSGVATIEIKSGYGLDVDNEIRMLQIARRIGAESGLTVQTTLLAAHTVPPEFAGRTDAYVELVCHELIPRVAELRLADAVDAYCESIAFSADQVARVFEAARSCGLPVKLHADQLSDGGGAALASRFNALSADHLEYASTAGLAALAESGAVAVLLPGAFLTLNETRRPDLAELRRLRVPLAVATDCNPGTSPLTSLLEAMALASRLFALTPAECLAGATCHAARALGLDDRGVLASGKRADIAVWDIVHPRDLCYWVGADPLAGLLIAGRDVSLRRS